MAGQTAGVVADAPLAPVTALTGPLPAAISEPILSVAAISRLGDARDMASPVCYDRPITVDLRETMRGSAVRALTVC